MKVSKMFINLGLTIKKGDDLANTSFPGDLSKSKKKNWTKDGEI